VSQPTKKLEQGGRGLFALAWLPEDLEPQSVSPRKKGSKRHGGYVVTFSVHTEAYAKLVVSAVQMLRGNAHKE
jgi:hypothetical protein